MYFGNKRAADYRVTVWVWSKSKRGEGSLHPWLERQGIRDPLRSLVVNLNFNIAHEYLEMLKDKELIKHENGLFTTTNKGKVFHEMAKEIKL